MRSIYRQVVPEEQRLLFYRLRRPGEARHIRSVVFGSPKGNFSIRKFDESRCVFVHVTKAAGTSVALALFGELPGHRRAIEYRVMYGSRTFRSYFKFAFVRNPWARLYSAFRYLNSGGWNEDDRRWAADNLADVNDFETFVLDWLTPKRRYAHIHFVPQLDFLCDRRGRILVDYVGHVETLEADFRLVSQHLGLDAELSWQNATVPSDYRAAYTPAMREKVEALYQDDVARLGYDFDRLVDHVGWLRARRGSR